jgi:hypothetical protein
MSDNLHLIDYIGMIEPRGQLIPAADFPLLYEWVNRLSAEYRIEYKRTEKPFKFIFPDLSGTYINDEAMQRDIAYIKPR